MDNVVERNLTPQTSIAVASLISNPYIIAATANNTRKAYQSDIRHYERWGGLLPASSELVSSYLQFYADKLNSRTLARRLTALKNWHQYQGFADPHIIPPFKKLC